MLLRVEPRGRTFSLFLSLGEALAEELTSYRADHLNKPMRRGLTERCTPCGRDLWLSTTERLSVERGKRARGVSPKNVFARPK
uniref:Uncharacterized protein n=1 Tax=Trichogramma kaykai TaxID=54128 RepID=A0ABD2W187_9HYME